MLPLAILAIATPRPYRGLLEEYGLTEWGKGARLGYKASAKALEASIERSSQRRRSGLWLYLYRPRVEEYHVAPSMVGPAASA